MRDLTWSRHQLEELAERRFIAAQSSRPGVLTSPAGTEIPLTVDDRLPNGMRFPDLFQKVRSHQAVERKSPAPGHLICRRFLRLVDHRNLGDFVSLSQPHPQCPLMRPTERSRTWQSLLPAPLSPLPPGELHLSSAIFQPLVNTHDHMSQRRNITTADLILCAWTHARAQLQ